MEEKEIGEIAEEWRKRLGIKVPLKVEYNSGYQVRAFAEKKYKKGPTISYKLIIDPYIQLDKTGDKKIAIALIEEVIEDKFEAQRRVERVISQFERELTSWLFKRFGIGKNVLLLIDIRSKVREVIAEFVYNLLKARAIP